MASLTKDLVRTLAGYKSRDHPVISLYLDVDGKKYPRPRDYQMRLERLMRDVSPVDDSTAETLRRVEIAVSSGLNRSRVRGIAVFACGSDLWEFVEMPVPVHDQLAVNQTPQIRQLEAVLDHNERFALLLVDKQRARLLVFELGELLDRTEIFDRLPRGDDKGGEWDRDHLSDHAAAVVQQHLKRAADAAFELFKQHGFDRLIVGSPEELSGLVESSLHSYLRDRLVARITMPTTASDPELTDAAMKVAMDVEAEHERRRVERLRDAIGTGAGVAGPADVLKALFERRVELLLVSEGYEHEGWRCGACGNITLLGRACPQCGSDMRHVRDIVEEAIEEALNQSCQVAICVGNADLDVLGRIGALLRF